jgi:probable selenium-dependent hydroxylase accessory protein YqeC
MLHFRRIDPVHSIQPLKYVSFIGGGGKTSLIEYLAKRLIGVGQTVAITTTTKIYARPPYRVLTEENASSEWARPLVRVGKRLENGKLTGVDVEDIKQLGKVYDKILIEADGAKGKPLKFPASYEPVIPAISEKVYVLAGLDALSGTVDDKVFRSELFRHVTGVDSHTSVTPELFLGFFSEHIMLKGVDPGQSSIMLNKYDMLDDKDRAVEIARRLAGRKSLSVIVASVLFRSFYEVRVV